MKNGVNTIGVLTTGGDCPGLNAVIRGVTKAAIYNGIKAIGVRDGFRGLVENRTIDLDESKVSGILTQGGTILGTGRDRLDKMDMGGQFLDMTQTAIANIHKAGIDCLVCLGGDGTQRGAAHLVKHGQINVITLPKTIDNDVAKTETTFGFDTALSIATDAIDRLHTTATSHHRIIICEIMGNRAGWLTLGAGIAGGADVILIPEIPYDINVVADHILYRQRKSKRFSIIAMAEGAISSHEDCNKKVEADSIGEGLIIEPLPHKLARNLKALTGIDARVTSLGHVQRGGSPSPTDRLLCTSLGTTASKLLKKGVFNVMVGVQNNKCVPIPLEEVAGITKFVPLDHPWLDDAKLVDTCLGV